MSITYPHVSDRASIRPPASQRQGGPSLDTLNTRLRLALYAQTTARESDPRWLVDALKQRAKVERWDAAQWQAIYHVLESLTRPGHPWHGQAFAQAAMRLAVAQSGDAILAALPVVCVACYAEAGRLDLPASCRLHPCARHQAEARA